MAQSRIDRINRRVPLEEITYGRDHAYRTLEDIKKTQGRGLRIRTIRKELHREDQIQKGIQGKKG